jgi:hypothetical protein
LAVPIVVWAGITLFLVVNDGGYGEGWGDNGTALIIIAATLSVVLAAAAWLFAPSLARPSRARGRRSLPH